MAKAATRKARSRQTEDAVAQYLRHLYPRAVRVPASLPGRDVLNTPGLAMEVKARRDLNLVAWLRQARKNSGDTDLPAVAHRPDGFGPESIEAWPVTITMRDFVRLLMAAGYGGYEFEDVAEGEEP